MKFEKEFLAFSSGWVAFVLALLPGLGTGYIYQRHWRALWRTFIISVPGYFLFSLKN